MNRRSASKLPHKSLASFLAVFLPCASFPADAALLRPNPSAVRIERPPPVHSSVLPLLPPTASPLAAPGSLSAPSLPAAPAPVAPTARVSPPRSLAPTAGPSAQADLSSAGAGISNPDESSADVLERLYSKTRKRAEADAQPVADVPESLAGRDAAALSPAEAPGRGPLTRVEDNPRWADVPGRFLVKNLASRTAELSIPQAARLAAFVARALPPGRLDGESMTEIFVVSSLDRAVRGAESRSGKIRRARAGGVVLDADLDGRHRSVYILRSALDERLAPAPGLVLPSDERTTLVDLPRPPPRRLGGLLPGDAPVFVGGLSSISAEPPEGFFAAATHSELKDLGWKLLPAARAKVWIYRTPDARSESYFKFGYPSADRPVSAPYGDKFKIATGIGTSHDPTSEGGAEADLLWLGDEMQGTLADYLTAISKPGLTLTELERHQGFIQRLNRNEVYVGRIDKTHALTQEGFDGLTTDPAVYRRVYSETMDDVLLEHLNPADTPRKARGKYSFVLATSRGCGQGCSICPSGGLARFQAFSAQRIMRELGKIADHVRARPGEVIDLFFIDSNFNRDPGRIIELADLLDKSPLKERFHFYCRHNSVPGFLKPDASGALRPDLELIDAYARLGISPVFLGIDAFEDAGIRTLKTSTSQLARFGARARPTYTFAELRGLVRAFEDRELPVRGFYLVDNPWVGDLDRVDSYYNLFELWLENPHFTIDSGRETYLRLKPMAGAPITEVAQAMERPPVAGFDKDLYTAGRFSARGPLGEMDELPGMQRFFQSLRLPRRGFNIENVAARFREGIAQVRRTASRVHDDPKASAEDRKSSELILRKLAARDAQLMAYLREHEGIGPRTLLPSLLKDMILFADSYRSLPPFEKNRQEEAAADAASSLISGLRRLLDEKHGSPVMMGSRSFQAGYDPGIADLKSGAPHTIKDLDRYIEENLGKDVVRAKERPDVRFVIVEGDGQEEKKRLEADGWRLGRALPKSVGFHRFYEATTPEGLSAVVALHVNGRDRLVHIQSFFKLLGVPAERVLTLEGFRSWKGEYLATFRTLGYVPDAAVYGMTWNAVEALLARDPSLDRESPQVKEFFQYFSRPKPAETPDNDIAMRPMKVIELADGRRIWFFMDLYGKLGGDLMEALLEHGVRNITALGTAGSLDPASRVGDWYTPTKTLGEDGLARETGVLTRLPGVPGDEAHTHVATPNLETREWLERAAARGVKKVEVEFKYILEQFQKHPGGRYHVAHAVSDVMVGPNHQDLTETSAGEIPNASQNIGKILGAVLDLRPGGHVRIKSLRTLPFVELRPAPENQGGLPTRLERPLSAEQAAGVARLARELAEGPINGSRYGSEAGYLRKFSDWAASLFGHKTGSSQATTQLILAVSLWANGMGAPVLNHHFRKNMAIISNHLYLQSSAMPGPERMELADIRARFGIASVQRLAETASGLSQQPPAESKEPGVKWAWLPSLVAGSLGRALRETMDFIAPRDLSILGFPSVSERWARSPRLRGILTRFYEDLVRMDAQPSAPPPGSVWELALRLTGGNAYEAMELLGGIIGQFKVPLRYVERHVLPSHPEAAGADDDFARAARAFLLLGRIHERSVQGFGRSALYPEDIAVDSPKFWHFYGAGMLGARLRSYPRRTAQTVGTLIAIGYEATTFPVNVDVQSSHLRELARVMSENVADSLSDVHIQSQGHAFGRSVTPDASPPVGFTPARPGPIRALFASTAAIGNYLWFWFWWKIGPPTRDVWRSFRDRIAEARRQGLEPAAIDPRMFFSRLRIFGWSGRLDISSHDMVLSDESVLQEARDIFATHIRSDAAGKAAFERFLDRAVRYNPGKRRTKLHSSLAYHLRESSLLETHALAAYYDGLAHNDEALAATHAAQGRVMEDLDRVARQVIGEVNRSAAPGRRALGVLVFGSYANGAPRPGSDIDIQIVTENGSAPAPETGMPKRLQEEWAKLGTGINLDIISFTYLPPSPELLALLHPEAVRVLSPYPEVALGLSRTPKLPAPASRPIPRMTPAGRLLRMVCAGALRLFLRLVDLSDGPAVKAIIPR